MFKRTLYLFFGILLSIGSGAVSIYPIYSYYIKNLYKFSLREINLYGSFINIGCWVAFGMGIIYDTLGPTISNFIGFFFLPFCLLILKRIIEIYSNVSLFWFLFMALIMGQGSALLYTSALTTSIKNFSKKNSSNIVGLIVSNCAISPSIFACFKEVLDTLTIPEFIGYVVFHISIIILFSFCFFNVVKDNKDYSFKEKIFRANKQTFIVGLFGSVNFFGIIIFIILLVINHIFGILLPAFMVFPVIHIILLVFVIMEKCHQFDEYLEDKYDKSHGNFNNYGFDNVRDFPIIENKQNSISNNNNIEKKEDKDEKKDNELEIKNDLNNLDENENQNQKEKSIERRYTESENIGKIRNKFEFNIDENEKISKKDYSEDIKMSKNLFINDKNNNENTNIQDNNINYMGEHNINEEGRFSNENNRFSSINGMKEDNNINKDEKLDNDENKEKENINENNDNLENNNNDNKEINNTENINESSNLSEDDNQNDNKKENNNEQNENSNMNENEKNNANDNENINNKENNEEQNNNRISYPKFSLNSNNNDDHDENNNNQGNNNNFSFKNIYPKFSDVSNNNENNNEENNISNNNYPKFSITKEDNDNDNKNNNGNGENNNNYPKFSISKENNNDNEQNNNISKNNDQKFSLTKEDNKDNNNENNNIENNNNSTLDNNEDQNNKNIYNKNHYRQSSKNNIMDSENNNMNQTQNNLMPSFSPFGPNYHLEENEDDEEESHNKCVLLLALFRKPQIMMFFIVLILTMGSMISNVNNIKFIVSSISSNHSLSSTSLDKYPLIYFSFNSVARVLSGASMNSLMGSEHTFAALQTITIVGLFSQILGIFMTKFTIYISISMAGVTHGSMMTFLPLYCRYYYNVNDMGTVLGFLTSGNAIGSILISTLIFPHFYHKYSTYDKNIGEYCSGKKCFRKSYLINCLFMAIAAILSYWIYNLDRKKKIKERKERENMYKTAVFCN